MKKSQRARLAELNAKAEADRSAAEKTEHAALTQLATLHPDASKDIDDANPAAAANAAPASTVAASPAAGANAPPAPAGTLRGFIQSLRSGAQTGSELVTARQQIATLTTERDQARQSATVLVAQVNAFAAFFGFSATDLAGKSGADVTALIDRRISEQAAEQVAALGVPPGKLPGKTGSDTGSGESLEELQAAMATERDPVKLGQLAAKANALRDKAWGIGKN